MTTILEAPKSGFIHALNVSEGTAVKRGDIVATMDDSDERIRLYQLDMLIHLVTIARARLSPERIDRVREVMLLRKEVAAKNLAVNERIRDLRKEQVQVGEANVTEVLTMEAAIGVAFSQDERLKIENSDFDNLLVGAGATIDNFERLLAAQRRLVEKKLSQLTLRADSDGKIRWYVFPEGYVEAGTLVAKIE